MPTSQRQQLGSGRGRSTGHDSPNPLADAVLGAAGDRAGRVGPAVHSHHPATGDFPSQGIGDGLGGPPPEGDGISLEHALELAHRERATPVEIPGEQ